MRTRWLAILGVLLLVFGGCLSVSQAATYSHLETVFHLAALHSDPFDYARTDVKVRFQRVNNAGHPIPATDGPSRRTVSSLVEVPAFFDGGTEWRARLTPPTLGHYRVATILLNGKALPVSAQPNQWTVTVRVQHGFIRVSPVDKTRLRYDDGTPYFPLGHNQAWRSEGLPDIPALFDKMSAAGENWSRVWAVHWGGTNLDWPKSGPFGTLSLEAARRWDTIITAAERDGIALQMTLQHHGQYSTTVNPNWDDNPYNVKNGGFLQTPNEFFTNAQAKALTKRKLRYSVARWGYSPSILAWELFNEVQFTDAARAGQWDEIAAWHRDMAAFLRAHDPYHHLVTTSSTDAIPASVETAMDYYQEHTYPSDLVASLHGRTPPQDKPYFVGEFGPANLADARGIYLHAGLWAGLMSGQAGAPQYWTWDEIEKHNLYGHFRAAAGFVHASGLAGRFGLQRSAPTVTSSPLGDLNFGPGAGWTTAKQSDFVVTPSGAPEGMSQLPQFLQGTGHREMNPAPLTFRIRYAKPGRFSVNLNKIAALGAHLVLRVDGQTVERDFAAAPSDYEPAPQARELSIAVPAGEHTITLQNTGRDWVVMQRFTLSDYAPTLAAYALNRADYAVAWVYHRGNLYTEGEAPAPSIPGSLRLNGLKPGRYKAVWWDTEAGRAQQTLSVIIPPSGVLQLKTPPVVRDVALFVTR